MKILTAVVAAMFVALVPGAQAVASSVTINDPAISSGYVPSYYVSPTQYSKEVDVIGVYETRSDHGNGDHPAGTAYVHVNGSSNIPVDLVLSSYEPTNWVLDGTGLSFVNIILTNGYQAQTVSGVDPAKVVDFSGYPEPYLSACAYQWTSSSGGCNTPALASALQSYFGVPVSSFAGVYRATDFTVTLVPSPVPEPASGALLLGGLLVVGAATKRRARND